MNQHSSNFFEVGTTFLSQDNSADHLTLIPFESKFINFVAYVNTIYLYAIWHVLLLVYDIQYMTISTQYKNIQ